MRSLNKTYTITEYNGFTRGATAFGYQALPEKAFDALESFILGNITDEETEAVEFFSMSARRGIGNSAAPTPPALFDSHFGPQPP